MAKSFSGTGPTSVEYEGVEDMAKKPATPPPVTIYTKCFLISHPAFGSARVKEDTEDLAVAAFCGKKSPGFDIEEVRKKMVIRELQFVPAATEADKPHGWVKDRKKVSHAYA